MAKGTIGVGLIGANLAGSWGVVAHLPAIAASSRFRAVAVAASHLASACATADSFSIPAAYDDVAALIADPLVDVVTVCVRVPHHRHLVQAALAAGKHVYCEWPLAIDTADATGLADLAAERGSVAMIGLQARLIPALAYARDLLAAGEIGTIVGASLDHSGTWPTALPRSMSYLQDRATGATFLTICGGHALDALCQVAGEFSHLSAAVDTRITDVTTTDDGAVLRRTSPDQVAICGVLESGALATVRLHGGPGPGTGFRLEINGSEGNLLLTAPPGTFGFQMGELALFRTGGADGSLVPVVIPESYELCPAGTPAGPPKGVGRSYARLADAIDLDRPLPADFGDALRLHRFIDAIEGAKTDPAPV